MDSSGEFSNKNDQFHSQSRHISFESLLLSDQEEETDQPKSENITLFTRSTAWYVINSHFLNPRISFGHFERGEFNLYDSTINPNSKFVRPYLPSDLRLLIRNMRVVNFSNQDIMPRCLHFPLQEYELKALLAILSNLNLNNYSKINKSKLIFLMRIAGRVMEGRLSFDAARILKDVVNNKFTIKNDDVGIFSVPTDHPVHIDKKMTIRSIPLPQVNKERTIALNNRIVAISSNEKISIIDTENKRNVNFFFPNIQCIKSVPNGNFLTCSKYGFVHEIIKKDFGNFLMNPITRINDIIGNLKISYGGERNYAISNESNTTIYTGISKEYYKIDFGAPFVDYDVNNDDVYVATEKSIEYYQWENHYASWNSREEIVSINIDNMASSIGCCTKGGCFIVDLRSPHINAIGAINCHNLVSLHMSPFLDLAVAITENGMISFDMRQTDNTLSQITFHSKPSLHQSISGFPPPGEKINIKGQWMPESRLFALAYDGSFNITCPYLRNPILESYKIPNENIISLHSNLQLSAVQSENSITFIGGFGYPFHIPSVL